MYNYNNYLSNGYFRNTTPTIMNNNQNNQMNMNNNLINNNQMNNNQIDLFNPEEGYEKGNMFRSLYEQYKDYKPRELTGNTDEEKLFLEMSKYAFAAHDLKLFLDVNPTDNSMSALYSDYMSRANDLMKEYKNKYLDNNMMEKWPWERRNN